MSLSEPDGSLSLGEPQARSRSIVVAHGPNLNLLGQRQPAIYGHATLDDLVTLARARAEGYGYELISYQSNSEADLVGLIHGLGPACRVLILNAGALTHYSWAIADAIASKNIPTIELHITNPAARESFRTISVLAQVTSGSIAGFGSIGYALAVDAAVLLDAKADASHG